MLDKNFEDLTIMYLYKLAEWGVCEMTLTDISNTKKLPTSVINRGPEVEKLFTELPRPFSGAVYKKVGELAQNSPYFYVKIKKSDYEDEESEEKKTEKRNPRRILSLSIKGVNRAFLLDVTESFTNVDQPELIGDSDPVKRHSKVLKNMITYWNQIIDQYSYSDIDPNGYRLVAGTEKPLIRTYENSDNIDAVPLIRQISVFMEDDYPNIDRLGVKENASIRDILRAFDNSKKIYKNYKKNNFEDTPLDNYFEVKSEYIRLRLAEVKPPIACTYSGLRDFIENYNNDGRINIEECEELVEKAWNQDGFEGINKLFRINE